MIDKNGMKTNVNAKVKKIFAYVEKKIIDNLIEQCISIVDIEIKNNALSEKKKFI